MHGARKLAPFLLLSLLAAGCAGQAEETGGGGTTTPPTNGAPTTTTPSRGTATGFRVDDLRIVPAADANRTLHEDDAARITYTLVNPSTEGGPSTFLVSYMYDGVVEDVTNLRLAPGESKSYERVIDDLRDLTRITVEVRAGSERAKAEADIAKWPRTGERADLGPVVLTVNRWLKNATDGWTDVNVTAERKAEPMGNYSMLRARVLCADTAGKITGHGEARPNVPEPGTSAMTEIHIPGCPETLYGVEFTGRDADDKPLYLRILFVDASWRPPVAR